MICQKCGEVLDDRDRYCPHCGAPQRKDRSSGTILNPSHYHDSSCTDGHDGHGSYREDGGTLLNPGHSHDIRCTDGHDGYGSRPVSSGPIPFPEAIRLWLRNFSNYTGRARRSEYWWVSLFTGIASALLTEIVPDLVFLWNLAVFVPTLTLSIRRLHDIGKSGWWYILSFIPFANFLLIFWYTRDSEPVTNRWGRCPKD